MKPPTGARQRKNDAHRSEIDRNSKNMMSDENVKDMSRSTKELLGSTKTEITRTRRQRKEESVGLFESGGVVRILTRARLNIEYWRYWHHPFRPWPQWKKCLEHTSSKTSRTHTHTPTAHTNSHTHARAQSFTQEVASNFLLYRSRRRYSRERNHFLTKHPSENPAKSPSSLLLHNFRRLHNNQASQLSGESHLFNLSLFLTTIRFDLIL